MQTADNMMLGLQKSLPLKNYSLADYILKGKK